MGGKYNGVQVLVKEKFGAVAEYAPYYARSLNLVGACAAQSCPEIVQFFDFVENIYVFIAASTNRWSFWSVQVVKCKRGSLQYDGPQELMPLRLLKNVFLS